MGSLAAAAAAARIAATADCILRVAALPDDAPLLKVIANPLYCVALLKVVKLPSLGVLAVNVPGDGLHVVRHRRKRLDIVPVVVDPDKEGALGGAESGVDSGARSTASVLCAAPSRGADKLEF